VAKAVEGAAAAAAKAGRAAGKAAAASHHSSAPARPASRPAPSAAHGYEAPAHSYSAPARSYGTAATRSSGAPAAKSAARGSPQAKAQNARTAAAVSDAIAPLQSILPAGNDLLRAQNLLGNTAPKAKAVPADSAAQQPAPPDASTTDAHHQAEQRAAAKRREQLSLQREAAAKAHAAAGYLPITTDRAQLSPDPALLEATYKADVAKAKHDNRFGKEQVTAAGQSLDTALQQARAQAPQMARRELTALKRDRSFEARLGLISPALGSSSPAVPWAPRPQSRAQTLKTLATQYVTTATASAQGALATAKLDAQRNNATTKSNLATVHSLLGYIPVERPTVFLSAKTPKSQRVAVAAQLQGVEADNAFAVQHNQILQAQQAYAAQAPAVLRPYQRAFNTASSPARKAAIARNASVALQALQSQVLAPRCTNITSYATADNVAGLNVRIEAALSRYAPNTFNRPTMNTYGKQKSGGQLYRAGPMLNNLVGQNLGYAPTTPAAQNPKAFATQNFYSGQTLKAIQPVAAQIIAKGGTSGHLLLVPVVGTGGIQTVLFQVLNKDRTSSTLIDDQGITYSGFNDYQHNNKLPSGGVISMMRTTSKLGIVRDPHSSNVASFVGSSHKNAGWAASLFNKASSFLGGGALMLAGGVAIVGGGILTATGIFSEVGLPMDAGGAALEGAAVADLTGGAATATTVAADAGTAGAGTLDATDATAGSLAAETTGTDAAGDAATDMEEGSLRSGLRTAGRAIAKPVKFLTKERMGSTLGGRLIAASMPFAAYNSIRSIRYAQAHGLKVTTGDWVNAGLTTAMSVAPGLGLVGKAANLVHDAVGAEGVTSGALRTVGGAATGSALVSKGAGTVGFGGMMGKQALDTAEHPTGAGLEGLGENLALMAGGGFGELGGRGILRLADILRRPPPDPTVSDTPSPIVPGGSPQGAESDMLPEDPLPVLAGVELPGADTHEFALPPTEPTASSGGGGPSDQTPAEGSDPARSEIDRGHQLGRARGDDQRAVPREPGTPSPKGAESPGGESLPGRQKLEPELYVRGKKAAGNVFVQGRLDWVQKKGEWTWLYFRQEGAQGQQDLRFRDVLGRDERGDDIPHPLSSFTDRLDAWMREHGPGIAFTLRTDPSGRNIAYTVEKALPSGPVRLETRVISSEIGNDARSQATVPDVVREEEAAAERWLATPSSELFQEPKPSARRPADPIPNGWFQDPAGNSWAPLEDDEALWPSRSEAALRRKLEQSQFSGLQKHYLRVLADDAAGPLTLDNVTRTLSGIHPSRYPSLTEHLAEMGLVVRHSDGTVELPPAVREYIRANPHAFPRIGRDGFFRKTEFAPTQESIGDIYGVAEPGDGRRSVTGRMPRVRMTLAGILPGVQGRILNLLSPVPRAPADTTMASLLTPTEETNDGFVRLGRLRIAESIFPDFKLAQEYLDSIEQTRDGASFPRPDILRPRRPAIDLLHALEHGRTTITLQPGTSDVFVPKSDGLYWSRRMQVHSDGSVSPAIVLYHEMQHAWRSLSDPARYVAANRHYPKGSARAAIWSSREELRITSGPERRLALALGENPRTSHWGDARYVVGGPDSRRPLPAAVRILGVEKARDVSERGVVLHVGETKDGLTSIVYDDLVGRTATLSFRPTLTLRGIEVPHQLSDFAAALNHGDNFTLEIDAAGQPTTTINGLFFAPEPDDDPETDDANVWHIAGGSHTPDENPPSTDEPPSESLPDHIRGSLPASFRYRAKPDERDLNDARVEEGQLVIGQGAKREVVDPETVLGPLLGYGYQKVVFAAGHDKAIGILSRTSDKAALRDETATLSRARELGFRAVNAEDGFTVHGLPGILYHGRYVLTSRNLLGDPQSLKTLAKIATQQTLDDLDDAAQKLQSRKVGFYSTEFLFESNGRVALSDPTRIYEMSDDAPYDAQAHAIVSQSGNLLVIDKLKQLARDALAERSSRRGEEIDRSNVGAGADVVRAGESWPIEVDPQTRRLERLWAAAAPASATIDALLKPEFERDDYIYYVSKSDIGGGLRVHKDINDKWLEAQRYLSKSEHGINALYALRQARWVATVDPSDGRTQYLNQPDLNRLVTIEFNPNQALINYDGSRQTAALSLLEEEAHLLEHLQFPDRLARQFGTENTRYSNLEDARAIGFTNAAAAQLGEGGRSDHGGVPYATAGPTSVEPIGELDRNKIVDWVNYLRRGAAGLGYSVPPALERASEIVPWDGKAHSGPILILGGRTVAQYVDPGHYQYYDVERDLHGRVPPQNVPSVTIEPSGDWSIDAANEGSSGGHAFAIAPVPLLAGLHFAAGELRVAAAGVAAFGLSYGLREVWGRWKDGRADSTAPARGKPVAPAVYIDGKAVDPDPVEGRLLDVRPAGNSTIAHYDEGPGTAGRRVHYVRFSDPGGETAKKLGQQIGQRVKIEFPATDAAIPTAREPGVYSIKTGIVRDNLLYGSFGAELDPLRKVTKLLNENEDLTAVYGNVNYQVQSGSGAGIVNKEAGYYGRLSRAARLTGAEAADERLLNAFDPPSRRSRLRRFAGNPSLPEDLKRRLVPSIGGVPTAENSTADPGVYLDQKMAGHPWVQALRWGELTTFKEVVSDKLGDARTVLGGKLRRGLTAARERGVPLVLHVDSGRGKYDQNRLATSVTTDRRYWGRAMRRLQEQGAYKLNAQEIDEYNNLPPEKRQAWLDERAREGKTQRPLAVVIPHFGLGKFVTLTASHLQAVRDVLDDPLFTHVKFDASWSDVIARIVRDPEATDRLAHLIVDYPGRWVYATDMMGADTAAWYNRYAHLAQPLHDRLYELAGEPTDATHVLSLYFGGTVEKILADAEAHQTEWKRNLAATALGADSHLSRRQQLELRAWAEQNPSPKTESTQTTATPPIPGAHPGAPPPRFDALDDNRELTRTLAAMLNGSIASGEGRYPLNLNSVLNDYRLTREPAFKERGQISDGDRAALMSHELLTREELKRLPRIPVGAQDPLWGATPRDWSEQALDAADAGTTFHRSRASQLDAMVRTEVRHRSEVVRLSQEAKANQEAQRKYDRRMRTSVVGMVAGGGSFWAFLKVVHPVFSAALNAGLFMGRSSVGVGRYVEASRFTRVVDKGIDGIMTARGARFAERRTARIAQRYGSFQPWRIEAIHKAYAPFISGLEAGRLTTREEIAGEYGRVLVGVRSALSGYATNLDPLAARTIRGRILAHSQSASYIANVATGLANPLTWYGGIFASDNATLALRESRQAWIGATPDHIRPNPGFRRFINRWVYPSYAASGPGLFFKFGAFAHPVAGVGWTIFTAAAAAAARYGWLDENGTVVDPDRAHFAQAAIQAGIFLGVTPTFVSFASKILGASSKSRKSSAPPPATTTGVPPFLQHPPLPVVPPVQPPRKPPAHKTPAHKTHQVVVTAHAGVNERARASVGARLIGTVRAGTLLQATGNSRTEAGLRFVEVEVGKGKLGWVAAQYVADHPGGAMNAAGGRIDPNLVAQGYKTVKVEPGDSIAGIAIRNHVSVSATIALNAEHIVYPNLIFPGDIIYLPERTRKASHAYSPGAIQQASH
jgi:LysM repeat protein